MTSQELAVRTAEFALTKKAENVISMDLRGLTSTCDFFVICNGTSGIQVKAIADAIKDGLTDEGEKPWHVEGADGKRWILLDCIDVVVHVFDVETRDYYQLERLWGDAKFRTFEDRETDGSSEPAAAGTPGGQRGPTT
ncbi:MAG: ribosome silencing factor [Candidatus Eisenbacteria bacterium]|nr:ribosome silencing factor [Candidatus Eisenbacteria bacterium]